MPVPSFDSRGLLPPFIGTDAATSDRSPYLITMAELVSAFGTTSYRRQLLLNLIQYRAILAADGYVNGLQFIDGSFVENVEAFANRDPNDIDICSILSIPDKYIQNPKAWQPSGIDFWTNEIADRDRNKQRLKLDTYALLLEDLQNNPMSLVSNIIYWYGLFSHQRNTLAWKGFAAIALDPADDQTALTMLGSP